MKRTNKLVLCLCLVVFVLSGCNKSTKKDDVTVLFLANGHVEGYPTSVAGDYFAERVKEKTKGRIIIETYNKGVLGTEASTTAQVQVGGIDFARIPISILSKFEPSLNALQLPYLYRDEVHMWNVLNGSIGDTFLNSESMKEKGILGLAWYSGGSRNFYNSKKEVSKPDDLVGLKIRVQESKLMMGMVEAMGGSPVPVAMADVYSALKTGVVDGAENNWPTYASSKHYELAKYLTIDEHTRVPEMLIASVDSMSKLSQEDQKIISDCAIESAAKQLELWKAYEDESIKIAEDNGVIVTKLNASQVAEFQKSVEELNKTEGAAYKDIIDAIAATK